MSATQSSLGKIHVSLGGLSQSGIQSIAKFVREKADLSVATEHGGLSINLGCDDIYGPDDGNGHFDSLDSFNCPGDYLIFAKGRPCVASSSPSHQRDWLGTGCLVVYDFQARTGSKSDNIGVSAIHSPCQTDQVQLSFQLMPNSRRPSTFPDGMLTDWRVWNTFHSGDWTVVCALASDDPESQRRTNSQSSEWMALWERERRPRPLRSKTKTPAPPSLEQGPRWTF